MMSDTHQPLGKGDLLEKVREWVSCEARRERFGRLGMPGKNPHFYLFCLFLPFFTLNLVHKIFPILYCATFVQISHSFQWGFCSRCAQYNIGKILCTKFKVNNFFIGKRWATNFFKRKTQISMRKVSKKKKGATFVTEHAVEQWLLELFEYASKRGHEDIWRDKGRLINFDETGFVTDGNSGRLQKFITRKGARYVAKEQVGTQQQITVGLIVSNSGEMYNPFIIVPSASPPGPAKDILVNKALYPEANYWQTKDGWMTSEAFVAAIKLFYEEAQHRRVKFPVIMIVDGYAAHISLEVALFCNAHDIILYCLLPHATNILQPLDVTVMGPSEGHLPRRCA